MRDAGDAVHGPRLIAALVIVKINQSASADDKQALIKAITDNGQSPPPPDRDEPD